MSYKPKRPLPPGTHPLVILMFSEMENRGIPPTELDRLSGIDRQNIESWRELVMPKMIHLEWCLNALGFELKAEKKNKSG